MSQSYRLKISRNALKLRVAPRIPAQLSGANFITITKANGVYTFDVDYSVLSPGPISDPTTAYIAISDTTSGIYRTVSLSSLLTSGLDADLQAIAALTGTGILVRTGTSTWALRMLTGTANEITVTNGTGVSGNQTVSLPTAMTMTGKTLTGGTYTGVTITSSTFNGNTWIAGTGTLTIAAGKTLTTNNSLTLAGTDGTTMTFPSTNATIARTDAANTFTGTQTIGALVASFVNGNQLVTGTWLINGAAAKTFTFNNTLTLAGTDGTTMTFPGTSATLARTDAANTFTGTQTVGALVATTVNGNTFTTGTYTLTGTAGKTFSFSNSLTLAGTDGTVQTFPSTSGTVVTSVSSNVVTNAMRSQMAAATLKGNVTSGTANEADFTIQGLTNLAAPSATLDFIPIYDHVSGTIKSVTPGAVGSVGSVASIGGATGVITLGNAQSMAGNVLSVAMTTSSNVLGADVNLNVTANYFDGPSMAQGTSGTWFVSATVTLLDAAAASYVLKLWDGTTVIASTSLVAAAGFTISCTLSGIITSPAANIRVSVREPSGTGGKITFNTSGNSKDSNIWGIRII